MRRPTIIALACCALAMQANAAVLYKSVDARGVITFSDLPPDRGVEAKPIVVPESSSAVPGAVRPADPVPFAPNAGPTAEEKIRLGNEAVQRASAQVDMAEHALAVARRPVWEVADPMKLQGPKMTRADRERIDYFRQSLKVAQTQLADVLKASRRAEVQQTMTAEAGMPIYGPSSPIFRR